jgi:tetratricopeptide (TPR) repeat protein/DNA-binding XRE family transcriptional regulator
MPQPPKALSPSRSGRDWFGAELRHWRTLRSYSQEALGAIVHVSGGLIAKIEKGERGCTPGLATALDNALDTGGVLLRALAMANQDADRPRPDAYTARRKPRPSKSPAQPMDNQPGAGEASGVALGSTMAMTSGETRVACRTPDGRIIFVTMPRRVLLRGATAGAALLPLLGSPTTPGQRSVSHDPAELLSGDIHPVENLRALRRSLVECDNLLGPRELLAEVQSHIHSIQALRQQVTGRDRHDLMQVQAEYAEFCSWLCQDSGDFRAAQYWADRAVEWSTVAGDHSFTVYTMARKAQLAGDMHCALDAVDLAEAAQRIAPPHSKLLAMGAIFGAHGHALRGEATASEKGYEHALALVSRPSDEEHGRGRWLNTSYIEARRAQSLSVLGRHEEAVHGFEQALRALPANFRRDRGLYLAHTAVAQVHAAAPGQAATSGLAALAVATATGSARIFTELATLDAQLRRWPTTPETVEFQQALDSALLHTV